MDQELSKALLRLTQARLRVSELEADLEEEWSRIGDLTARLSARGVLGPELEELLGEILGQASSATGITPASYLETGGCPT